MREGERDKGRQGEGEIKGGWEIKGGKRMAGDVVYHVPLLSLLLLLPAHSLSPSLRSFIFPHTLLHFPLIYHFSVYSHFFFYPSFEFLSNTFCMSTFGPFYMFFFFVFLLRPFFFLLRHFFLFSFFPLLSLCFNFS